MSAFLHVNTTKSATEKKNHLKKQYWTDYDRYCNYGGPRTTQKKNQLLYFISFILLAISPGVIFSYNIRKHAG